MTGFTLYLEWNVWHLSGYALMGNCDAFPILSPCGLECTSWLEKLILFLCLHNSVSMFRVVKSMYLIYHVTINDKSVESDDVTIHV